ncbi:Protein mab-21-like 3 [Mizuhopecten yessoensis]|uniref:Protein mab-21-like 3 n=1 Tax=Mizuhopecten yessoensis TaxID=6573 RepID=A0A210PE92_MIZYE|nr:Protein mab-21-like 3 [Mizuhopecten yessoensis]
MTNYLITTSRRNYRLLIMLYIVLSTAMSVAIAALSGVSTLELKRPNTKSDYLMALYTNTDIDSAINEQCPVDDQNAAARSADFPTTETVEVVHSRTESEEHGTKHSEEIQKVLERYMRSLLHAANMALPIERYLYKMLQYYKERIKEGVSDINIVGSTGNKLYVPELQPEGSYQFEVDVLFENPIAGMSIPVLGERGPVVAWLAIDTLDNSLPLGSVVLRVERYDGQFGSEFEKGTWFHKHTDSGKLLLSSFHYWGSVVSSYRSILGERELLSHPAPLLQPLFRKFKSARKSLPLSGQTYEFDILMDKVASVRIPWPEQAASFKTRTRKWPESSIIEKVVTDGCHLVHNPHTRSGTYLMEWKYTFSTSEQEIVLSFSPFQRSVFLVIKQIKRIYLDYGTSEIGEPLAGLTTYHLKTVMLWLSEKLDSTLWGTSPHECLIMFFRELEKCLDTEVCPHYFMPEINVMQSAWKPKMLQHYENEWLKQNGPMREKLLKTVRDIISRPGEYLTDKLVTAVDSKHVMEAKKEPVQRNKGHDDIYAEVDILDQALVRLNDQRAVNELKGT